MMRTRAYRERMRKRVYSRWPLYWNVPPEVLREGQGAVRRELRALLRRYGVPRGSVVEVEVLRDYVPWVGGRPEDTILRVTPESRRDINQDLIARWLSDPAERTP